MVWTLVRELEVDFLVIYTGTTNLIQEFDQYKLRVIDLTTLLSSYFTCTFQYLTLCSLCM